MSFLRMKGSCLFASYCLSFLLHSINHRSCLCLIISSYGVTKNGVEAFSNALRRELNPWVHLVTTSINRPHYKILQGGLGKPE